MPIKEPGFLPHLHFLEDKLWENPALRARSRELTPLYVDRYRGPRYETVLWSHEYWELSCVISGKGTLLGKEKFELTPNTIYLVPPHVPHDECAERDDLDTIWIGLRGNRLKPWILKEPRIVNSKALSKFLQQVWVFAKQQGGPIGPELDGMVTTAVAWFSRLLNEGEANVDTTLVDRAVRHFEEHFAEPIYIPDVAKKLECSAGHFHRLFKQQTGRSPTLYLIHLRIQHASRLLTNTQMPVAEIARMVGFEDQFYFSRLFRKITGQAPTASRRQSS